MFEQELYHNFSTYLPKPYFVTFAGDVSSYSFFCTFSVLMLPFYLRSVGKGRSGNRKAELHFLLDATRFVHSWFSLSEHFRL